jgi:hypothetical protein
MKTVKVKLWVMLVMFVVIISAMACKKSSETDSYILTVTVGQGISGSPATGKTTQQKGDTVSYSYSLQSGYQDLVVTLDGATTITANGIIIMNGDHTLAVSATPAGNNYTLAVSLGVGTTGTPAATASYAPGTAVPYSYSLQSGYQNLVVTFDGTIAVPPSGTITMNGSHTLVVSATPATNSYALTVSLGAGVTGTPAVTTSYAHGAVVPWSYSLQSGYTNLVVKLDGATTTASGSVTMNANHALTVSATAPAGSYTLTVSRGSGVAGSPSSSGSYAKGSSVSYSYTLETWYYNLVVKLDGVAVAASGSVTMNANHTLAASATDQVMRTITVTAPYDSMNYYLGWPLSTIQVPNGSHLKYYYSLSGLAPSGSVFSVFVDNVSKAINVTSYNNDIWVFADHTILLRLTK